MHERGGQRWRGYIATREPRTPGFLRYPLFQTLCPSLIGAREKAKAHAKKERLRILPCELIIHDWKDTEQ